MTAVVVGIVLLTYVGVALGGVPRTRMNRATIALVGRLRWLPLAL